MKFLPLIWSGIWRKPGRLILTFLQVAVAFLLFGMLQGLKGGVAQAAAAARADLLIVHSRLSLIMQPLPLGLLDQIRSVPGVKVAIPVELSRATYQSPSEMIGVVAVSPQSDWPTAFTFTIAPEALAAFRNSRTAMLITDAVAEKYHWKVGDHIPLMLPGTPRHDGSTNWAFDVVGTYGDSDVGGGRYNVLINFSYYDEARASGKGNVNHFNVAVKDPRSAVVVDSIDRLSANSSHETKTESLREMAQAQVQSIGDFDFLIRAVLGAVLAALLFSTMTMMIHSIRERTSEFAVIKTIGFTDWTVFRLVLAETLVVFVGAALSGLALAGLALPFGQRFVLGLSMPGVVVWLGTLFAMAVALVSASVPAMLAARLKVAAALAREGTA